MNELNKTMELIRTQLDNELCNKLSNPTYLKELKFIKHYYNFNSMLDEIKFDKGFKDNLNKKGKQVLIEYENLSRLLNYFKNSGDNDALAMIDDYSEDWTAIDNHIVDLEKYSEYLN